MITIPPPTAAKLEESVGLVHAMVPDLSCSHVHTIVPDEVTGMTRCGVLTVDAGWRTVDPSAVDCGPCLEAEGRAATIASGEDVDVRSVRADVAAGLLAAQALAEVSG